MAPKLYSIMPSPPVRAVVMCAKALDLELKVVPVDLLKNEHMQEIFLQKNPQHTVPLLEEEDGFCIPDSHAIMAYLVSEYGKDDSLYPKNDNRKRAIIDHRLHFDSSVLFVRGLYMSKPLVFEGIKPKEPDMEKLREAFQTLDKILEQSKTQYIAADHVTIADFSIITTVTSWDIFVPYANYPNLKAYVERFQKLPCYKADTEGLASFKELLSGVLKKAGM